MVISRNNMHYRWSIESAAHVLLFNSLCARTVKGLVCSARSPASCNCLLPERQNSKSHISVALTAGSRRPQQERCTASARHINRAPLNGTGWSVNWCDWPPGDLRAYSAIKKEKKENRITASGLYASAFQSAYISALTHTVKTSEEYFKRYHHHIVTDVDLCPPKWKKFI